MRRGNDTQGEAEGEAVWLGGNDWAWGLKRG